MQTDVRIAPPKGLDAVVGFHLRLAQSAVYRHFSETFADLDLTQKQVSVLWVVEDAPGISQIEIGTMLRMDRATTMALATRLERRGYLRRCRSPSDGRKQALSITAEGQEALAEARICIARHEKWLKSRFSSDEVGKLVEMLARIHEQTR